LCYFTGIQFVRHVDNDSPVGIEENYLGNEEIEDITVMKFKKGERENVHYPAHPYTFYFAYLLLSWGINCNHLPSEAIKIVFNDSTFCFHCTHFWRYLLYVEGPALDEVGGGDIGNSDDPCLCDRRGRSFDSSIKTKQSQQLIVHLHAIK